MSSGNVGGGWKAAVPGGESSVNITGGKDVNDFPGFVKDHGGNGIVINGIILWIDIQQEETAFSVWKALAFSKYTDDEIRDAKRALWMASGEFLTNIVNRQGDNMKSKDIDDIHEALSTLKRDHKMPLIMATTGMVRRNPCYNVNSNSDVSTVENRVLVLENSVSSFMKQQKDNMNKGNKG